MQDTRLIMGMPITVHLADSHATGRDMEEVFAYFTSVDERFSPYKVDSEVSRASRGDIAPDAYSADLQEVFALAEKTKRETRGYFNCIRPDGQIDPSGIVKGWAIQCAADALLAKGFKNFYIDAGGDIQSSGVSPGGSLWSVGIRNPFNLTEIVKVVYPRGAGVATSGSYIRGKHIYSPHAPEDTLSDVVSLTVIGPNVLEADRFATAAFAMGNEGVVFIESLPSFEAYEINAQGIARFTSGFSRYTVA